MKWPRNSRYDVTTPVVRVERFTNALHTDNGHETNRECRVA